MTDEEKKYVDQLIADALVIETDEAEGQQVIDLDALSLCAIDFDSEIDTDDLKNIDPNLTDKDILQNIYSDSGLAQLLTAEPDQLPNIIGGLPIDNKIIIEFAEPTIKQPEELIYKLSVNPGDNINETTILGYVEQEGQMKKIKSIFEHAHVCGVNDDTEFLRLFPDKCNRHIILDNALVESGKEYDISQQLQDINEEFKTEAVLFQLITDNMCQSLLPYILSRRYRGVYIQKPVPGGQTSTTNTTQTSFNTLDNFFNSDFNIQNLSIIFIINDTVGTFKSIIKQMLSLEIITAAQHEELEKDWVKYCCLIDKYKEKETIAYILWKITKMTAVVTEFNIMSYMIVNINPEGLVKQLNELIGRDTKLTDEKKITRYWNIYTTYGGTFAKQYIIKQLFGEDTSVSLTQIRNNKPYIGEWILQSQDLYDVSISYNTYIYNKDVSHINNLMYDNNIQFVYSIDNNDTGVKIYDEYILQEINNKQNQFATDMLGVSTSEMNNWKRRAKKKKNRKKVQEEIQAKADAKVNTIKSSKNFEKTIQEESDKVIKSRDNYIDKLIKIYEEKDKLPLCKYDPEYTDCKFLVNDNIDKEVLSNVKDFDDNFSYTTIGETEYMNYYSSLLAGINLQIDNEYVKEYYQIITDIIKNRMTIETIDEKDMKVSFMKLFNENIKEDYFNISNSTEAGINAQFILFENKIKAFVIAENKKYKNDITKNFKDNIKTPTAIDADGNNAYIQEIFNNRNFAEESLNNAGTLYTDDNQYRQICDYIRSIRTQNDEDTTSDYTVTQLATMYMYIRSHKNSSKTIRRQDQKKYIYFELVKQEAKKITDFWDKIIKIYKESTLPRCIENLTTLANSFSEYATWPIPSQIEIDNIRYQHYLFEYMPKKDLSHIDNKIDIGDYSFPTHVDFPDIPDDVSVNEADALNDLNNPVQIEPTKDKVTIFDLEYWQRYFTLASIISIPFLNCGLDLLPFIQLVMFPCLFIALACVYIPFFNLLIVFGYSFRLMYFSPVILYINTSDQPSSILTPLIGILNQVRNMMNAKIDEISIMPITQIINMYIKKLQEENNKLIKDNKKYTVYQDILKNVQFPDTETITRKFASVVDPSIDLRQRYVSLDRLSANARIQ